MSYSRLFLKLLEKRGVSEGFLAPRYEDLSDPFLLPDMKAAVSRIRRAAEVGEKILIYGDYDVDGVTATAEMYETLILAGVPRERILTMLPDRFLDGYGMSERAVERAKAEGASLVITVDCGSNNGEVIDKLEAEGVEVIVTDHHELMGEVPKAVAVVNPKREGVEGGLRRLSGAGVAFFIARALALEGLIPEGQEKWLLDLAMIGTICDAMELVGENRVICRYGMIVLAKTRRPGLKELMKIAGTKKIDSEAIGFQIGPRLNAAGRMESAEAALELLLTDSQTEAVRLAMKLNELNAERKRQQGTAVREIEERGVAEEPVMVVSGEWHEGVLGIIAGNLTEKYRRPSFVLAETEAGILKGSGRSFGEFDLAKALKECAPYIIGGGGHAEACGVKVEKARLEEFRAAVNEYYRGLGLKNQKRFLKEREDLTVGRLGSLSLDFMGELELLQPFGTGNPEPRIRIKEAKVRFADRMGTEGQHLKLTVCDDEGEVLKLLAFNAEEDWLEVRPGETVSALIAPMVNEWNGVSAVEGRILELVKI